MSEKIIDKKELIQRFRSEGILDAAIKVIAQRGLEKATMEQVAEEAGISKATIYLYFRNKEELYHHCVVTRFAKILAAMKEAADGVEDPAERISAIINVQVKSIEKERDFFRVFLTEKFSLFMDDSTEMGQGFWRLHNEYSEMITGALREGMEKGFLRRMDPIKGFYLLFSMVRGMAMCKIVCRDDTPLSNEAGLILDVYFNGIKKRMED